MVKMVKEDKMNIEMCDREYWKELNYYDGMIYCSILVIDNKKDWRMPTLEEIDFIYEHEYDLDGRYWLCQNGYEEYEDVAWAYDFFGYDARPYDVDCSSWVIPVRDV